MNLLNSLTIKHLKMNKKRTLVTIIGVMLSTALMVGIGLLFASFRDYLIKEIKIINGEHHFKITNLDINQLNKIKNDQTISKIQIESKIGYALLLESENQYKPYLYINGVNQQFLNHLDLLEGRLPVNENEIVISKHIETNGLVKYKIGDILDLEVGNRYHDDCLILSNGALITKDENRDEEQFKKEKQLQYKIVGIVKRHYSESYEAAGYSVFTLKEEITNDDLTNVYLNFKHLRNFKKRVNNLANALDLEKITYSKNDVHYPNLKYNNTLLELYGVNKYENVNLTIIKMISIILGLISIGCIIVIYNSFAISVMERKKQFGLLSSLGATKKQLQKTVFYEAFIVGIIGIPLGLLSSFIGIGTVLAIINHQLSHLFIVKLGLSFYPLFIIVPLIFMSLVIILSAFLPAKKASKISPIKAIRLNDDIKIKSKKLKVPKIVRRLFKIEGEIAYKNIKRNQGKYRITILSLFISIVMFLSFSSLLQYGGMGIEEYLNLVDYDINLTFEVEDEKLYSKIIDQVKTQKEVTDFLALERLVLWTPSFDDNYHDDYQKVLSFYKQNNQEDYRINNGYEMITLLKVDNDTYDKYKKSLNLKEETPIFINQFERSIEDDQKLQKIKGKFLKKVNSLEIDICENLNYEESKFNCVYKLNKLVETNKILFGINQEVYYFAPIVILSPKIYNEIRTNIETDLFTEKEFRIKTNDNQALVKVLEPLKNNSNLKNFHLHDFVEQTKTSRNLVNIIKLLLYGFISLVTLIGVTSVFNTINTSIALRRKEFAVLRSVGLTTKGFNQMIRFETIMVGFKSLLYGIIVSLGIILLIHYSIGGVVRFSTIIIPWKAVIFAIFGVFLIVTTTMMYATNQIKRDNILDSIREENI